MKKPIIINLFGAPGAGKSTGAAYIFSQLKLKGISCELVTEYAKDKVYEQSFKVLNNQAYVFGKQFFRITRLENEVDFIITDSPILLSNYYNRREDIRCSSFYETVKHLHESYDSYNIFVNRIKKYNNGGRLQTEEESAAIANDMLDFLSIYNVDYVTINGCEYDYDKIVNDIINKYTLEEINNKRKVITLCGSTKFKEHFLKKQEELTFEGNLVLTMCLYGHIDFPNIMDTSVKVMLDEMHKQKIEMSDAIYVINPNGYIGSSTRSEIEYARSKNKEIIYMEE